LNREGAKTGRGTKEFLLCKKCGQGFLSFYFACGKRVRTQIIMMVMMVMIFIFLRQRVLKAKTVGLIESGRNALCFASWQHTFLLSPSAILIKSPEAITKMFDARRHRTAETAECL